MAITGVHALLHSPQAEELRRVLADGLDLPSVDAGGGWLIFALPPAELGAHPADAARHELALMCDDLDGTVRELRGRGIAFDGEPETARFGTTITMVLPGDVRVMLYEPSHPTTM